ncbi:MAG: HD domain-containing protein [Bacteroidota bacterium]
MAKIKILNDPIYGLISFPFEIIYDLIDHPYFQRLRRICQVGLTSYVYPGATHTRFHHAIGATHLADRLIQTLRKKGVEISDEEHEACMIATLLHDIGHGPFSHALEFQLIEQHHEDLTKEIMRRLDDLYAGRLGLARAIFDNRYEKQFLIDLISSQIDVDRMDYLNRDSYYTGVAEGVIGYDRIIAMMNVQDGRLVIEKKGLHSVEKFLISRYLMYQQVYLHPASISAEQMLKSYIAELQLNPPSDTIQGPMERLLSRTSEDPIGDFLQVDDYDIYQLLKSSQRSHAPIIRLLASGLMNRRLFKTIIQNNPWTPQEKDDLIVKCCNLLNLPKSKCGNIVIFGCEENLLYRDEDEIRFSLGEETPLLTLSQLSKLQYQLENPVLHFVTYPKGV